MLDNLRKHHVDTSFDNKVKIIMGDIAKPNFGIESENFSFLSKEIDAIYHNAAWVNHLYNYDILKATNVYSTKEMIKFAFLYKKKQIVYISTLSVLSGMNELEKSESLSDIVINISANGYIQTKSASEVLLKQASERKLDVMIFRPGTILGHSKTGACSPYRDHFLNLVKYCVDTHYAPITYPMAAIPVDFLSDLIVRAASLTFLWGKVFNVYSPKMANFQVLINLIKKLGYEVSFISIKQWIDSLKLLDASSNFFPFASIYIDSCDRKFEFPNIQILNTATERIIKEFNLKWPELNIQLIKTYFTFLIDIGFVKPPKWHC